MTILHLLTAGDPGPAQAVIERQRAEGDATVDVVLLPGASALSHGLEARRVPDDLDYAELLDLIFASDQVIAW